MGGAERQIIDRTTNGYFGNYIFIKQGEKNEKY